MYHLSVLILIQFTGKIITLQGHCHFLRHCIIHQTFPKGLNLSPNCLSFVNNDSRLLEKWNYNIQKCGMTLLKLTIQSLDLSIKPLKTTLLSEMDKLQKLASSENFKAITGLPLKYRITHFRNDTHGGWSWSGPGLLPSNVQLLTIF